MLVADIVRRNAAFFGDDDAVVDGTSNTTSSWSAIDERSNRLANLFGHLGLAPGERVAILSPNDRNYISFFFACSKAGILGAPLNIRLTAHELSAYLAYVQPQALLVDESMVEVARRLHDDVAGLTHLVGFGAKHGLDIDLDDALGALPTTDPAATADPASPYMLAATSGTTGVAKAALLTNANAVAAMFAWIAEMPVSERGTALQNIPLFFNPGGPAGLHPVMLKGGRTVILPGFDPEVFLGAVGRFGVTHTILVPTMVRMVLDHPESAAHDLSSLVGVVSGGSPFSADLLREAVAVFGDVFYPTYGMAETYSCGLVLRREDQRPDGSPTEVRRLGSAGKPHVNLHVRVVDRDGNDVVRDGQSPGEIIMAGDTVAAEYFRMPEETAAAFSDGWMHTGDLATIDAAGFITVVDRLKDVIISGGINVHGREVEEVLLQHPSVGQAAVIGLPHPTWGEAIHAVVVAAPGALIDADEVLSFCAEQLAGYKRPRSLEVRAELPVSATGKVLKRLLREPRPLA